tara:strand:- start:426 stop:590 length:165 start_codon:yes stop_codon:yes gene_type:complete
MEKEKAGDCRYPKPGVGLWKHGFTLLASCFPPLTLSSFSHPDFREGSAEVNLIR